MKKFKRIFYPIYLICALGMVYFSLDSLFNMEQTLTWVNSKFSLENQPYWVMVIFLLFSVLMVLELIVENVHIKSLKDEIPELEDEIVRLKAKLFDQSEEEEEAGD